MFLAADKRQNVRRDEDTKNENNRKAGSLMPSRKKTDVPVSTEPFKSTSSLAADLFLQDVHGPRKKMCKTHTLIHANTETRNRQV